MNKKLIDYFMVILGILLLVGGLVLIKLVNMPQGVFIALPYICIGVGCGIFGHGMGDLINLRLMSNHPDIKKQMEIEQKDERHIAIQNHAKARAYDLMIFVFGALMICFALMNVDMMAILMLVSSYLFIIGYSVYCRVKYEKEM